VADLVGQNALLFTLVWVFAEIEGLRFSMSGYRWEGRKCGAGPRSSAGPARCAGASVGGDADAMRLAVEGRDVPATGMSRPAGHVVRYAFGRLRRERTHLLARAHVIANRLQPFQNALPLGPIELSQIRPKTLNERVLQHRFTVRFGYEKAVQANAQRLGDFFKCSEAGGHLATFDPREVRTGNARAGLQLALRHAAGFAQLADPLADILDGLAVRPILEQLTVVTG